LKKHGHKLTPQRRAILRVIAREHDHLSPAQIHQKVSQDYPGIGLVTVYRTLEVLDELDLLCQVHSAGDCRGYLLRRPAGHHHHLVCTECGMVVDFADCDLSELQQRLAEETGFDIEGHVLEFSGRCLDCRSVAP